MEKPASQEPEIIAGIDVNELKGEKEPEAPKSPVKAPGSPAKAPGSPAKPASPVKPPGSPTKGN